MRDEINLDSASVAGAMECGRAWNIWNIRSVVRRIKGKPRERRRWREMGGWLSSAGGRAGRPGVVFCLVLGVACTSWVSRCYGGTGMNEVGATRSVGCKAVSRAAISMMGDAGSAGSRGVAGSSLGEAADTCGGVRRNAGVHRRWQPWQLRFGLREAWCCAPRSPTIGVSRLRTDHCEHARGGGNQRADGANGCEILKLERVREVAGAAVAGHAFAETGLRAAASRCTPIDLDSAFAVGVMSSRDFGSAVSARGASYQNCSQRVSDSALVTCRMPSATQLVQYFGEALGESPNWQGGEAAVFQRTECLQWGVSWRRGVVEVLPRGVGLRWLANDDFGLSELREFFEAPFFEAAETERFYRWFSEGGWHQEPLAGGVMLRMGVLRGRRATLVEISWRRAEAALGP